MEALIKPGHRLAYMLAGNVIVTIVGRKTRFTFKVVVPKSRTDARWIHVLRGENNTADYAFIGGLWLRKGVWGFSHSSRSGIGVDAASVMAFDWLFNRHVEDERAQVYHSGKCGRCGRVLTTPESIQTGLGPVCAGRAARTTPGPRLLSAVAQAARETFMQDTLRIAGKHHGELAS